MQTCKHGKVTPDGGMCWECDDERAAERAEEKREAELESEMDVYCEHDMLEEDCHECGAEIDRQADQARDNKEWNHFHPSEE